VALLMLYQWLHKFSYSLAFQFCLFPDKPSNMHNLSNEVIQRVELSVFLFLKLAVAIIINTPTARTNSKCVQ